MPKPHSNQICAVIYIRCTSCCFHKTLLGSMESTAVLPRTGSSRTNKLICKHVAVSAGISTRRSGFSKRQPITGAFEIFKGSHAHNQVHHLHQPRSQKKQTFFATLLTKARSSHTQTSRH